MESPEPVGLGQNPPISVPNRGHSSLWLVVITLVLLLLAGISYGAYQYLTVFAQNAGISPSQISATVQSGLKIDPFTNQPSLNLVLLGIDRVGNQRVNSLLTDTIVLINLQPSGQITAISIPRDLWIGSLKTKINALYYYGQNSPDISGQELVVKTISEITSVPIDHVLIIDLDTVKQVIDEVGGVDIMVETAFTDDQYPRDDVAPDILPVTARYQTVSFDLGQTHLDGTTALQFIRSRKSQNPDENTDDSRSARQQKVLVALFAKLTNRASLVNPGLMGRLYRLWHQEVQTTLTDQDIIALSKHFFSAPPKFNSLSIPIQTATTSGIIFNPPLRKYRQWVYEPVDTSWAQFGQFFRQNLDL